MSSKKPAGSRDLVRFEVNERVDLPDMSAVQDNSRGETRGALAQFLFGNARPTIQGSSADTGADLAYPVVPSTAYVEGITNWDKNAMLALPRVTTTGTSVIVELTADPTPYTAWSTPRLWNSGFVGGVTLDDSTSQTGVFAGSDGDDKQELDMTGKAAQTYGVWLTAVYESGSPATRVFWNNGAANEDLVATDTRKLAGWEMIVGVLSVGPPNDGYQLIFQLDWDGTSTISNTSLALSDLFDGVYDPASTVSTSKHLRHAEWGDQPQDRIDVNDNDQSLGLFRSTGTFRKFAAIIRRQLADIIDADPATRWWKAGLPTVSRADDTGGVADPATGIVSPKIVVGEKVSLATSRDHLDSAENPHGATQHQHKLRIGSSDNSTNTTDHAEADAAGSITCTAATSSGNRGGILDWSGAYQIGSKYLTDDDSNLKGTTIKIGNPEAETVGGVIRSPKVLIGAKSAETTDASGYTKLFLPSGDPLFGLGGYPGQLIHYSSSEEPDTHWREVKRMLGAYDLLKCNLHPNAVPNDFADDDPDDDNVLSWQLMSNAVHSNSPIQDGELSTTAFASAGARRAVVSLQYIPLHIPINSLFLQASSLHCYCVLKRIEIVCARQDSIALGDRTAKNLLAARIYRTDDITDYGSGTVSGLQEDYIDNVWLDSDVSVSHVHDDFSTTPMKLTWDLEGLAYTERQIFHGRSFDLRIHAWPNGLIGPGLLGSSALAIYHINIVCDVKAIHP